MHVDNQIKLRSATKLFCQSLGLRHNVYSGQLKEIKNGRKLAMSLSSLEITDALHAKCQGLRDSGVAERWLAHLIAAPTQSQVEGQGDVLNAYLTDTIAPLLNEIGFKHYVFDNPVNGAPPFLVANRHEGLVLPTILIYGHGDVIHGQDSEWHAGLKPFRTVKRDGMIFGRGTADNKGQHLINLLALQAVLEVKGRLGFNVTLLLEMGEEVGSPGLAEFCNAQKDLLAADVLIASDGPRLMVDVPTVFLGSRGALNFDLKIDLRDGALHSGNWGGLVVDPAMRLAHALATLTDARGQIKIPAWRPISLTTDVRAIIAKLPPAEEQESLIEINWGEEDLSPNERVFGWNSFAILAMTSGVPKNPVNAIAGSARATCQLRYVVGTEVNDILPALRSYLDANGFNDIEICREDQLRFAATRQNADNIWVQRVLTSLEKSAGQPAHLLPNLAGSVPNECFSDILRLVTIWVPHSYRQCSQHAPNEHMPETLFHEAIRTMTDLFNDLDSEPI